MRCRIGLVLQGNGRGGRRGGRFKQSNQFGDGRRLLLELSCLVLNGGLEALELMFCGLLARSDILEGSHIALELFKVSEGRSDVRDNGGDCVGGWRSRERRVGGWFHSVVPAVHFGWRFRSVGIGFVIVFEC